MEATPTSDRIYSLDSLRAIMMLLGVVIHASLTYGVINQGDSWSLKDQQATHIVNDIVVILIHKFRMPIFFLVAGFFGSMLFYNRQAVGMIKNRISRIVLPFFAFLFLLWPTIKFAFSYSRAILTGSLYPFSDALESFSTVSAFIPRQTFHLWFLYYLIYITFVTVGLGLFLKSFPEVTSKVTCSFNWLFPKPVFRVIIFSGLTCLVYLIMGTDHVKTSVSFMPKVSTFAFYFFFYLIGWVLFKSKHLLHTMTQYDWACTVLAFALSVIQLLVYEAIGSKTHIIFNSLTVWLFIFGITGLFIRYGSSHSAVLRYVSDSSYWVYLVHMTFAALIPGLIAGWLLPAVVKSFIVFLSTMLISFLSYHYLVRSTFIGKFLNGRKYSRKLESTGISNQFKTLKTRELTPSITDDKIYK